ncbi:Transcriptional regulatory protein BaeR [Pseudomonas sp. TAD18]|nr:Transcriptional regulatory protein BaeR [Pseudomonas sp. TAD18]KVV09393.1 Transcriptional regulatory protein BaeR [Pseudomonas sp. TAA207]
MLNVLNQCLMRTSPHLLLVEDDFRLRHDLERHLLQRGFAVTACVDGTQGLNALQSQPFDLVLLDIMLPGLDGLSLLETLRTHQNVPVMLMSALGNEQDRISGFTRGADDYLPKPFSLAELDARTDALLRRMAMQAQRPVQTLDSALTYDDEAQDVLHAGHFAGLTGSEFRLLMTLREHGGQALSKAFLYQQVLHRIYTRLDRGQDVHVCNLRRKLAAVGVQHLQIQSVRSQGYILIESQPA